MQEALESAFILEGEQPDSHEQEYLDEKMKIVNFLKQEASCVKRGQRGNIFVWLVLMEQR